MTDPVVLTAGLRSIPLSDPILDGTVTCDGVAFEQRVRKPYTDTFREMARRLSYDFAEMPVVTHALAVDAGKPLEGMPIVLAGGAPHHASLLCLADAGIAGPKDLVGGRIGIRSYAQTTAAWVRGILMHEYGVLPDGIEWVVAEDAHVESFVDPAFVSRTDRDDLLAMLRDGSVDAIIASPQVVRGATDLRTVIADAPAVGRDWMRRMGIVTINHVVSLRSDLLERVPGIAGRLARCFLDARAIAERQRAPDTRPFAEYGDAANRRSIDLLLGYCHEQALTSKLFRYDDLFLPWHPAAAGSGGTTAPA